MGSLKCHLKQFITNSDYDVFPYPYDGTEIVVEYTLVESNRFPLNEMAGEMADKVLEEMTNGNCL